MSYTSVVQMNGDLFLQDRVAACAAEQEIENPVSWAQTNLFAIAADPQFAWTASWESGLASNQPGAATGAREDVITDAMILAAVQTVKAAQTPPPPPASTEAN